MITKERIKGYFSVCDVVLWSFSAALITVSFCIFDRTNFLTLIASLIGTTSLMFNAKGNPIGQLLMIVFSLLYGIISFGSAYYGEMITYLGMTAPMACLALVSWLKNPYNGSRSEVRAVRLKKYEWLFIPLLTLAVTVLFYFILQALNTANIIPSTVSVATSVIAVYLTFRRSPYFALAYAANDAVLMILWIMASIEEASYISVVICFIAFFLNDIYGFYRWMQMRKRQES